MWCNLSRKHEEGKEKKDMQARASEAGKLMRDASMKLHRQQKPEGSADQSKEDGADEESAEPGELDASGDPGVEAAAEKKKSKKKGGKSKDRSDSKPSRLSKALEDFKGYVASKVCPNLAVVSVRICTYKLTSSPLHLKQGKDGGRRSPRSPEERRDGDSARGAANEEGHEGDGGCCTGEERPSQGGAMEA